MRKTVRVAIGLFILSSIVYFAYAFFVNGVGADLFLRFQSPVRHQEIVERYSAEMNIDPNLVYAIIKNESNFRANAVSHAGASGLMQLMEDTAVWASEQMGFYEFTVDDIFNPEVNIRIGVWYIAHLLNLYDGNLTNALAAYNAGQGNVNQWLSDPANVGEDGSLQNIPFGETRRYVERVLHALEVYRVLYD